MLDSRATTYCCRISDPTVNVCMSIASRWITWALVSSSGGDNLERGTSVHPDDRARDRDYFDRALCAGSAYELELRLRKSDGSYRWFLARFNPVRDDNGNIIRWYVANTDIDDRKRAEERLKEENVALREEIDRASMFEEIVGTSPALQTVLSRISKVAPTDSTVLTPKRDRNRQGACGPRDPPAIKPRLACIRQVSTAPQSPVT